MEINGCSIRILKSVSRHSRPVKIAKIRGGFLGSPFQSDLVDQSIKDLSQKHFISIYQEGEIAIDNPGTEFLNKYDLSESQKIFNGDFHHAILKFLHDLNEKINLADFPKIFKEYAPTKSGYSEEYCLLHYLGYNDEIKQLVKEGPRQYYELSSTGKAMFQHEAEKIEIEAEQVPYTHIQIGDIIKDSFNTNSGIINNDSSSENEVQHKSSESEESRILDKKAFHVNKHILYWTIGIGLLTLISVILMWKNK